MTVGTEVARSAGWTVAMRIADRAIGFISMLVLARLLVPADFGLVAMATSVIALLDALTAFGVEAAVIQRQTAERRLLDTAWTLNALIGVTNAVLLLALIPVAQGFFNEPRLGPVMMVLAAASVTIGLRNVGMVLFEQQLQFRRIFALTLLKKLAGFSVTLSVALIYRSYWALVLGSFASAVAEVLFSYVLSRYRPRFALSAWRDIFSFSRWLYASNVLGFVNGRGTNFIAGRLAGPGTLGTMNMAYELGALPTSELVMPVYRALFPGCARLKDKPAELRSMIRSVIALMMLLVAPAAAGIVALAEPIVMVLLGARWLDVIPLLQVFGLVGAITAFGAPISALTFGMGRADIPAKLGLLHALIALPAFGFLLMELGIVPAAMGLLAASAVVVVAGLWLGTRLLGGLVSGLWRDLWRPLAAAAVMAIAVANAAGHGWSPASPWPIQFATLLLLMALGAAVYAATLYVLWVSLGRPTGPENQALASVQGWLTGRRPRPVRAPGA
jgi:lipopolysaccharide exporter